MFPPSPSLGNSCYEAIFSYDLGKSNSNDVGIGLTRPLSSLFGLGNPRATLGREREKRDRREREE